MRYDRGLSDVCTVITVLASYIICYNYRCMSKNEKSEVAILRRGETNSGYYEIKSNHRRPLILLDEDQRDDDHIKIIRTRVCRMTLLNS